MRQETYRKPMRSLCSLTFLAALMLGTPRLFAAAEDITGDWQITTDFNGRPMLATLTIAKKADGTLEGHGDRSALSNVKFEDGKLTFVRTIRFGDQEFTMNYAGTLKDGKLTGTLSSDQGDIAANGVRKKPKSPVLGQWDIKFNVMDRDITARLIITEKPDGTLAGQWTKEDGQHVVSNVKFQDGKLTLTRKSKIKDIDEFETTYEGTVKGNELTGVLKSEMGDVPANGQRVGAALIGKWELTIDLRAGHLHEPAGRRRRPDRDVRALRRRDPRQGPQARRRPGDLQGRDGLRRTRPSRWTSRASSTARPSRAR